MKVRNAPKSNQNKDGCNKQLKFVITQRVNVISLQIFAAIENY